jgi:hypothetical protein
MSTKTEEYNDFRFYRPLFRRPKAVTARGFTEGDPKSRSDREKR